MAVAGHSDPHLPAGHLLRIEPQPLCHLPELGLVGRLLDEDEQGDGDQSEREGEAKQPADQRQAEQQHEEQRAAQGIKRDLRPVGIGGEAHLDSRCGARAALQVAGAAT
jgi:hypothetical protein